MDVDFAQIARAQEAYLIGVRRELHICPELRWEEERTLAIVRTHINALLATSVATVTMALIEGKGGIWVDIDVNPRGQRILFRADVDGLPIKEETGLPFASTNGNMHACGHDAHTAMLLGFLRCIAIGAIVPRHNLRLVFQRAEENPITTSGGDHLVNTEGVCGKVARAYGLHLLGYERSGVFFSRPGTLLGNSGRMQITIRTRGGHVGRPNLGTNAIRIAHAVLDSVDRVPGQTLKPGEPYALEPTIDKAGTASNILPASAEMWYAVRTSLPRPEHLAFMEAVKRAVKRTVNLFPGSRVSITVYPGHPPTVNSAQEFVRISRLLRLHGEVMETVDPILGGEDFSHYLSHRPGAFVFLGSGGEKPADHHSPKFNPDESSFWKGVLYWLLLATH